MTKISAADTAASRSVRRRQPARSVKIDGPDPVDVHVGERLRLRRTLMRMSQEQVADAVGVTFQQIQKYERGSNRISASRLYDIAQALGVDIPFFFVDVEDATAGRHGPKPPSNAERPRYEQDEASRTMALQLLRSFWNLPGDDLRTQILGLLQSMERRSTSGGAD